MQHWLYKIIPPSRSACNFLTIVPWAIFGNDEDGIFGERSIVPTYGKDAPQTVRQFFRWWTRNPLHNLFWHVLAWPGGPYKRWGKPGVWYGYIGFRPPEGSFGFVLYRKGD